MEKTQGFPCPLETPAVPARLPPFIRYASAVPALSRIVGRFAPDLLNAHFLPNYGFMAAVLGREPWVLSTWGSDIMLLPQKSPFHMWRTRFVLKRATAVTSDALVMTNKLESLGVAGNRILTVPFGVDRRAFHPGKRSPGPGGPRILSNRKLEPVYDVATVIRAFLLAAPSLAGATLTVAGEGTLRTELEREGARGEARERICFLGAVEYMRMPELLRAHDLYVSASLSDTTSVSLLEAMACGLFPVVSDIPANREWIKPGENGLLFPPGDPPSLADAITRAWEDSDLRGRAREANLSLIADKADWWKNMERVSELFARITADAGKGR